MLYQITIYPIECVYKVLFLSLGEMIGSWMIALIGLSAITYIMIRPFMNWADRMQAEEKQLQSILEPQLKAIKKDYQGAEQHRQIQRLYTRYSYHPIFAIRSALGVILQLPFLMAAYYMLSGLPEIQGHGEGWIPDFGSPDGLLYGVNLLPILMTVINLLSAQFADGFSTKDKIQALVIAVFFMLLLYSAPAALLIYWTCNNLWTLLLNIWDYGTRKWGFSCPWAHDTWKRFRTWQGGLSAACFISLSLSMTLCLFIPMDIYMSNIQEMHFSAISLLPYLTLSFMLCHVTLFIVWRLCPVRGRVIYLSLLMGLILGIFVQSYLFSMQYGTFNGMDIPWEYYRSYGIKNSFFWILCLVLPLYYMHRSRLSIISAKFRAMARYGCIALCGIQFFSLCYIGANLPSRMPAAILTTRHMLQLSSRDNIIVLLLDAFDTKVFQEIREREPDILIPLDGFTYYPDALSLFGFTDHSLPQMLTGKVRQNIQPYPEYISDAWYKNEFYQMLKDNQYDISIYTDSHYISTDAPIDNCLEGELPITCYTLRGIVSLTLFRCAPHVFKKYFVIYSGDLWRQEENDQSVHPFSSHNVPFYRQLQQAGLSLQDQTNSFRWYHLDGNHPPYQMNRNIEYLPGEERSTPYEQGVGSLRLAFSYLQQMKEKNIYDNATILILADHGRFDPIENGFWDDPPLPLVLVKQPHEVGFLRESHTPISYEELLPEIAKRFSADKESTGFSSPKTERVFYYIGSNFDQSIIEYHVKPHAENSSSWQKYGTISFQSENKDNSYQLGTVISFKIDGNSDPYKTKGWQRTENFGSWIHGEEADVILKINNLEQGKDLRLESVVFPYLTSDVSMQTLGIYVNQTWVGDWNIKHLETKSILIPNDLISDGTLHIHFTVSDPAVEEGIQHNFVGVGFREIVLDYEK